MTNTRFYTRIKTCKRNHIGLIQIIKIDSELFNHNTITPILSIVSVRRFYCLCQLHTLIFFHHILFLSSLASLLKNPACCCKSSAALSMLSSLTEFSKASSTFSIMVSLILCTFCLVAANLSMAFTSSYF